MTRPAVGLEEREQLTDGDFLEQGLAFELGRLHRLEVEPERFGYLESLPGWTEGASGRETVTPVGRRAARSLLEATAPEV